MPARGRKPQYRSPRPALSCGSARINRSTTIEIAERATQAKFRQFENVGHQLGNIDDPVDMRRDTGGINPVNMQRDRRPRTGIAEPVNFVKSRLSKTTISTVPHGRAHRHGTAGLERIFGFRQCLIANRIGAPSLMSMDGTELARSPNERQNRKPPGWIAIDNAAGVAMSGRLALLRSHQQGDRGRLMEGRNHAVSHDRRRAFAGSTKLSDQRHQAGERIAGGLGPRPMNGTNAEHRSGRPRLPENESYLPISLLNIAYRTNIRNRYDIFILQFPKEKNTFRLRFRQKSIGKDLSLRP